jgi:hypothetical protein
MGFQLRAGQLHLHNFAGDWYAIAFDHLRPAEAVMLNW